MRLFNRRQFMYSLSLAPIAMTLFTNDAMGVDCEAQHPFMPPKSQYHGQCPVCGMVRPMWARTWITFDEIKNVSQVCSFHCLADWIIKSGQEPTNVMLTIYHQPEKTILSGKAFIVIGSTAAGTMSPVSKIVFADKSKAESFAQNCGGKIFDYTEALQAAKTNVGKENQIINARRLKKGKIVEPTENDRCPVCEMHPKRYPYGKCQIKTKEDRTIHFCSTQCLFAFFGRQDLYIDSPIDPLLIWVVDRNTGMWISGRTAFYVIGSKKVFGPMGYEALPFNSIKEAKEFTVENGGIIAIFRDVKIQNVVPNWKYPGQQ
ncbi:MAG: nitrous oxide reductase accessory protein NosL [Deltaproteobacteria bacterium]|jgi:nitrous oxide reductase accessory protein NosL|nr:nitrous oxide reductase accessory protein NosL [Deltaproteobacteria bacterium]